jgi:4-amino-4-deoxy-L-arabinose transferase-like glycosyltransferase
LGIFKQKQDLKLKLIKNQEFWAVLIISVIAFGLRFYRLGASDFWYDEVSSVSISKYFLHNWNPPVYFGILHYWIKLFGVSEFAVRFPSLVFSVASIPCLFFLGKKIFNVRVGLYSSLIICFSSFHLWYAQEARPYSLSVILSILSTYFLYRFLKESKIRCGVNYIIFSILGLYSDISYYFIFLLVAQFLAALITARKHLSLKLFLIFCLVFMIFLFRINYFIFKFLYVQGGFWVPIANLKSLIVTIGNFNLGYNVPFKLYWFLNLLFLIILARGFLSIIKKREVGDFIFVVLLIIFPLGLVFMFSKIFFPIYLDRAFIIFSPYYYLLLGLAIDNLKDKKSKYIVICGFLVISLISISGYYRNLMTTSLEYHFGVVLKKPFKPALKFVENNLKSGDIIMHTNPSSREVFEFYSVDKKITQFFLFVPEAIDSNWNRPYVSGPGNINIKDLLSIDAKRIWVVSCNWQRNKGLDDNSEAVNREMKKLYNRDLSTEFDGLWVYRYTRL